jgi:antitoxin component YwqK of YwqJK toxin-antitoxin module
MESVFSIMHSSFKAVLLLSLFATYNFAATKKPPCDSISKTIVENDTFTTEINCSSEGDWRVYREKNGESDGKQEAYHPNGKLSFITSYKNGKLEGHSESWSADGLLERFESYHNEHFIDTLLIFFHDGGKPQVFCVFDTAGRKNGWSMTWAYNGNLIDSSYYVNNEKQEAFYFWKSGKLMLYEKTRANARTHRYDILEAATFDSTGKQNGEVKGGNGRIIVLKPRAEEALRAGYVERMDELLDTLDVEHTQVQADEYFEGNFSMYQKEYMYSSTQKAPCDSISTSIVKNDTFSTLVSYDEKGGYQVIRTKNGKEDGKQEAYHPFGKPASISNYKNGKRDGIFESWSPSGFHETYEPYRNDHRIDTCIHWWDKDKLRSVHVFDSAGKKNGWSMTWDYNGILLDSIHYAKDKKKEAFYFWESGELMLYEKTKINSQTGSYDILEAATFDSAGNKNGEVKNGNGRIIIRTRRIGGGEMLHEIDKIDTLDVKGTQVQADEDIDRYLEVDSYGRDVSDWR